MQLGQQRQVGSLLGTVDADPLQMLAVEAVAGCR